jgi:hypothetical protein
MRQGEVATEAFYVVSGEVELLEIRKALGPGTLIGGPVHPGNRRTMSVRCRTEVHTATITRMHTAHGMRGAFTQRRKCVDPLQ